MRASFRVDKLNEGFLRAGTGIGFGGSRAFGEELEGRVRGDILLLGRSFRVLTLGVDFGDEDC